MISNKVFRYQQPRPNSSKRSVGKVTLYQITKHLWKYEKLHKNLAYLHNVHTEVYLVFFGTTASNVAIMLHCYNYKLL